MATSDIRPSTLEGIKRLATSIKREQQIPHADALDVAARRAGYHNFKHAQRSTAPARIVKPAPLHTIYLTAYWRDAGGSSGRETLSVQSREPWPTVLSRAELQRALHRFRVDADDHFETREDINGQERAREVVCEAARTLQFMDATALRPATGKSAEIGRLTDGLPGRDHVSVWFEPGTRKVLLVDEPYRRPTQLMASREAWAHERGAACLATSWPGMYYPGHAHLYFTAAADALSVIERCVARLNRLPHPVTAGAWPGESASYAPAFVSPARQTSQRPKRARPRPVHPGEVRRSAIAYGAPLIGIGWRPNARMPLEAHREAGNLLKDLLERREMKTPARGRLQRVRSELDEWLQREYSRLELSDDAFSRTYYHEFTGSGVVAGAAIDRIAELINAHYPDCAPRRALARALVAARKSLHAKARVPA